MLPIRGLYEVAIPSTTGSRARPSTSRTPTATNWSCSRPLR